MNVLGDMSGSSSFAFACLATIVALAVLALLARALRQGGARLDSASERAIDTWAAEELAALVESAAGTTREVLVDTFTGRAPDPAVVQWALDHGVRAEFTLKREGSAIAATLLTAFDQGRRETQRAFHWSELPESLRGRFIAGERTITLPWRPAWDAAGWDTSTTSRGGAP